LGRLALHADPAVTLMASVVTFRANDVTLT
jgi:hypothetical protein